MLTEETIKEVLRGVKYPGYSRDVVSFGLLKNIQVQGGAVKVTFQLTVNKPEVVAQIRAECERVLRSTAGVTQAQVEVNVPGTAPAGSDPWSGQQRMPGVRHVVAIASGKGGVGKSTVSVNLACALQQLGAKVGLLDCDIYGPSIPLMMGVHDKPTISDDEKMVPPEGHGVRVMSMGLLLEGDQPVIWRGPMIMKTIQQFIGSTDWGELDYLLVDLPPGTGDAQLSLCQQTFVAGAVIVTTPSAVAIDDAVKAVSMFGKLQVPVLGVIENMSYFVCDQCSKRHEIFNTASP